MPGPSTVLDYASPRPQGRFRLPSRSRLVVMRDPGEVTVTETLTGKRQAVGGIAVAVLTLLVLAVVGYALGRGIAAQRRPLAETFQLVVAFVVAGLWFTELMTMLAVINNTWRRTIVRVRDGALTIDFTSPFGQRHYTWPFDQLLEIRVDASLVAGFVDPRRELLIRIWGGQLVKPFTDHPQAELASITADLCQAVGEGHIAPT